MAESTFTVKAFLTNHPRIAGVLVATAGLLTQASSAVATSNFHYGP